MPLSRSRALGLVAASSLLIAVGGLAVPAAAADSPEAAVGELFEAVASRDLPSLSSLVCEAERDTVQALFDIEGQMGIEGSEALLEALTFEIGDVSVEVTDNDGQTATAQVAATMSMSLPDDQVEDLVRAMLETELGPGDPPLSEDDLAFMVPLMGSALNTTQPIDEEITLVVEDGQWLVCGGLGEVPTEPDYGFEPSVSSEGLCGLATPAELSTLSALQYDSSNGFEAYCAYTTSEFEDYHTTTVNFVPNQDAETNAGYYGADQLLEVGGAPAYATDPASFGTQLITQAGDDILMVSVTLGEDPPEGLDWLTQATLVAELFMPRLADFRLELAGPAPEPTPEPMPEISLCESLTIEALNERTALGFDEASGDSLYCGYTSTDGEPGFHTVTLSMAELALDDYLLWLPDMEETTVAGQRALEGLSQLIVELPGAAFTLTVSGWLDTGDENVTLSDEEMLQLVAELALPNLIVPEATLQVEQEIDLEELQAFLDDPTTLELEEAPMPPRPMCEYIDLDAVNGLGILEYDTVNSFFDEICSISQADFSKGYSEISVFGDVFGIDEARSMDPDGADVTVAGRPGYMVGSDLHVETSAGTVSFTAILPDKAFEAGIVAADIVVPVAELVVAAIEADLADG